MQCAYSVTPTAKKWLLFHGTDFMTVVGYVLLSVCETLRVCLCIYVLVLWLMVDKIFIHHQDSRTEIVTHVIDYAILYIPRVDLPHSGVA